MQPKITVIKAEGARYKLNFESDCGTITGRKVNVHCPLERVSGRRMRRGSRGKNEGPGSGPMPGNREARSLARDEKPRRFEIRGPK